MKKYLRIKMLDRFGVCGEYKEYVYVVNKKFCENWDIDFENLDRESLKKELEKQCKKFRIKGFEIF